MKRWVLAAVILAISASTATIVAEGAPCHAKRHRNCFDSPATVNFSSVPDISKKIVSDEPNAERPNTRTLEAPPITTYTGPTVGVSTMARAPTVGYYWSLEPQADTPPADTPQADTH
jgi:hypothetical protein